MFLRECVKERKMPVGGGGELTDINPVSFFLFLFFFSLRPHKRASHLGPKHSSLWSVVDFLSCLPLPVCFSYLVFGPLPLPLSPFASHVILSLSPSFLPIFSYMVVQEIILSQQEIDQTVPNTVFPFSPRVTGSGLPAMQ